MSKVLPVMAGRSEERPVSFPDAHLYRGRAGDGADCLATFDRRSVLLSREVAGLSCRIRLNVRNYSAVAVASRGDRHAVCLFHREAGLSVDLVVLDDADAAEAHCARLAAFLDLPVMLLAGAAKGGRRQRPAGPAPRRNRPLTARRPRFLTRRRRGEPVSTAPLEGREIIARA